MQSLKVILIFILGFVLGRSSLTPKQTPETIKNAIPSETKTPVAQTPPKYYVHQVLAQNITPIQQLYQQKSTCLFCEPPVYPDIAKQNAWKGIVHLKIDLSNTGSVSQVTILNSSNHEILDKTAVEMANKWLFTKSDEPVRTVIFAINFLLL